MGRRGMKGFLKGVHKHDDDGHEEEAGPSAGSAEAGAPAAAAPAPASAPTKQPAAPAASSRADGSDDEDDEGGDESGPETRGRMLQRHKRELVAHKKAMQKLGKAKKDEVAKLTQQLEDRHTRELAELDQRERQQQQQQQPEAKAGGSGGDADGDAAADSLAELALDSKQKQSKAQKRREKLAQQEAEREARIAEELAAAGPSSKAVEEEGLKALLAPLKLSIREIRADGHCLYRAVEDQLAQGGAVPSSAADYQALRKLAAAHIRAHPDDFIPFIHDEDQAGEPQEQLEAYCEELEGSAVWGGQLELGALAQALKRQIKVHAVGMPAVTLGDEHSDNGVLQLCYLRHAFGLGEHYNSVEPLAEAAAAPAAPEVPEAAAAE